ncbi:hypothetical protein SAMN05444266_108141 [Chitinophaga jiangningensis]|uniref:Tetratricopeptide repeat-containing protein n=1 Tax=Chitinophaga jiangningensis TaxID=1419482 RepID=A0A1M7IY02_9BACT|nr:DUF6340 family protein [Chitinophaga jiangningensis]SHM45592.1 hypothetical protein SAMN05444266_108141 [Chitinophaga jiangningensis]
MPTRTCLKSLVFITLAAATCSSCKTTELVHINVLHPAPVTIPAYIKNPGVLNRTTITTKNKAVDAVDKVFSLEGVQLDKEGAKSSVTGLADELLKNNRFSDVKALGELDLTTNTPGFFSAPLSWDTVDKICREQHVDALFSLELFDTDSKISYAAVPVFVKTPLGNVPAIEHNASMLTTVKTGWRIYDPVGRNILDEYAVARDLTFSGRGINPVAAAGALINRKEAVKQVGEQAGHYYAMRIIPYRTRVTRDYYVKGSDNFRTARRKAQTGNWDGAAELWKKETTNPSSTVAGRACYNMAIICEINGELDLAIKWSQKAYEEYNNKLALNYIRLLKNRQVGDEVLKQQQVAVLP